MGIFNFFKNKQVNEEQFNEEVDLEDVIDDEEWGGEIF
tara:strand:- start:94 stop:207 length:114 start_codon:yes stop_codon:yes gene_type:complete